MEDQSQSISPSPVTLAKQALTEKVWNLLVSAYTDNLSLNLDRFLRQNHLNRKRVEENLAEFGRSFESARFAAIIARRERKKALTRARNEKARADLLDPLLKALAGAVKGSAYNICDETYHKVLVNADDNESRGSRKGYLWDMIAPSLGLAYFFYDEGSRSEDVILNELENYEGIIQSDGLNAYKKVAARSDGKVTRLSCLQHCKRGFIDLQGNPDADFILEQANLLYANEHQHSAGTDGWKPQE